jgi:hypothetical protein
MRLWMAAAGALLAFLAFAAVAWADETLVISGDTEVAPGGCTTLTATWHRHNDITHGEWSVDGVGEGAEMVPDDGVQRQNGSSEFEFCDDENDSQDEYLIEFDLWHHTQGREQNAGVTVTVVEPTQQSCAGPFDNHGQYVSCVAQNESSPPGKGPVVKEAAKSSEGKPNQ